MEINARFFIELFGYVGTALVIVSMLMTSVVKLRVFNVCGSIIGMFYGILTNTWPNVILNLTLIIINLVQLIRMRKKKFKFNYVKTNSGDKNLSYFLFINSDDIIKYFPDYNFRMSDNDEAHIIYCESDIACVLIGKRENDEFFADIDYITAKYRDMGDVSPYLYKCLKNSGISTLVITSGDETHNRHFEKQGFEYSNGQMIKNI